MAFFKAQHDSMNGYLARRKVLPNLANFGRSEQHPSMLNATLDREGLQSCLFTDTAGDAASAEVALRNAHKMDCKLHIADDLYFSLLT